MISNFLNDIHCVDCLELLPQLPDQSIDLILSDLPFGITQNSWDEIIPIESLWKEYRRIIKDNGAIVLIGYGLFSAKLIMAAADIYKYTIIWKKNKIRGFLNANLQPLRSHEDILVFYKKQPTYNPQKTTGHDPVHSYTRKDTEQKNYGSVKSWSGGGSTERYPISVIDIPVVVAEDTERIHPTQKPVLLGSYLIKTFTNENDIVLDNACGSGSFLCSAIETRRKFIGIEKDKEIFKKCKKRIDQLKYLYGI